MKLNAAARIRLIKAKMAPKVTMQPVIEGEEKEGEDLVPEPDDALRKAQLRSTIMKGTKD